MTNYLRRDKVTKFWWWKLARCLQTNRRYFMGSQEMTLTTICAYAMHTFIFEFMHCSFCLKLSVIDNNLELQGVEKL